MARTSSIRSSWAQHTVDAAQILTGAIEQRQIPVIRTALSKFERAASGARTAAERLVLRGLLVDLYLVTEQKLDPLLPTAARDAARDAFCASRGDADAQRFTAVINRLLDASARAAAQSPATQARRWIDEHPAATSSIAEIAELVQTHPRTLRRQFLRESGVSIQEYRRRIRARYAEELLRSRTDTVDAIAALAGVKSRSTFYRLLRRWSDSGGGRQTRWRSRSTSR
jgi:AraC-like DNA-binding protein